MPPGNRKQSNTRNSERRSVARDARLDWEDTPTAQYADSAERYRGSRSADTLRSELMRKQRKGAQRTQSSARDVRPGVSDTFRSEQGARTMRQELLRKQAPNQTEDDTWEDTKPRDLPRDERIRRVNVARKQNLLRAKKKQRAGMRAQRIMRAGKGNLAQKTEATATFRAVWFVTGYAAPAILFFYILFLIAVFFAEANLKDAVALMGGAIAEADMVNFLLGLWTAAAAIFTGVADTTLEALSGFQDDFQIAVGLAIIFWAIAAIIGVLTTALILPLIYKAMPFPIHPLGGSHSTIKYMLFIGAILLHVFPLTAFAPWFLLWAWYVKKHPA